MCVIMAKLPIFPTTQSTQVLNLRPVCTSKHFFVNTMFAVICKHKTAHVDQSEKHSWILSLKCFMFVLYKQGNFCSSISCSVFTSPTLSQSDPDPKGWRLPLHDHVMCAFHDHKTELTGQCFKHQQTVQSQWTCPNIQRLVMCCFLSTQSFA